MTTLTSEITGVRYALSLTTPGERNANDQMATHADNKAYAVGANEITTPPRVTHGKVGPAGDNSDPDAAHADGVGGSLGTITFDEAEGRCRVGAASA